MGCDQIGNESCDGICSDVDYAYRSPLPRKKPCARFANAAAGTSDECSPAR
jgi:hypothetical protein